MSINAEGRKGEELARRILKREGFELFQPDWLGWSPSTGYVLVEVKHQERFESPPFDGHGLPERQVKARLRFQRETGIPTLLLVFDKATGEIFFERLDVLERGDKYVTPLKRRYVYPLSSFRVDAGAIQTSPTNPH